MSLTVGGWVVFAFIAIFLIVIAIGIGVNSESTSVCIVSILIAVILNIVILCVFNWYYTSTASGARAIKTQQSEFSKGIERIVTVYDMEGDVIKTYEGKFDVTYDNDRILFDDEKGQRHIIYYPTGTVIIDEVD